MDIIGHAVYGATFCSRSGLAGGRKGFPGGRVLKDWTVWAAIGFSLLPDLSSIGVSFAQMMLHGGHAAFHGIPPHVMALYRFTHNLLVAGLIVLLCGVIRRPLTIPALAWPLHILLDSVLHGAGRWEVPMFMPLTTWHYHGINWWQHHEVVAGYWSILPLVWLALFFWRRKQEARRRQHPDHESPEG